MATENTGKGERAASRGDVNLLAFAIILLPRIPPHPEMSAHVLCDANP